MTRTRRDQEVTRFRDGRLIATRFSILPCIRCGEIEKLDCDWKCRLCAGGGSPARPHPKPQEEPACGCNWHMEKSPTFRAIHTAKHLKRRAAA